MGKHKYIESPEKMWELFLAYKKSVKDNPRIKVEYVGKEGQRVNTPIERPLIMEGFRSYCRNLGLSIEHYFANTDNAYDEYRTVITRIREEIRNEQIDGGMVGAYNSNLTARLNNLSEKTETEVSGTLNIPNLPDIGNRE